MPLKHNLSEEQIQQVRDSVDKGDYRGAWDQLHNYGDSYADNAAEVIGPPSDDSGIFFNKLVKNHWDNTAGEGAYPFTKYGVIDGEVIDVSADAIEDERLGLLFPLKASMKSNQMQVNGKLINLKPGMTVTVEIKTGTRRLIEFLLAPLMKGVSEGARER